MLSKVKGHGIKHKYTKWATCTLLNTSALAQWHSTTWCEHVLKPNPLINPEQFGFFDKTKFKSDIASFTKGRTTANSWHCLQGGKHLELTQMTNAFQIFSVGISVEWFLLLHWTVKIWIKYSYLAVIVGRHNFQHQVPQGSVFLWVLKVNYLHLLWFYIKTALWVALHDTKW